MKFLVVDKLWIAVFLVKVNLGTNQLKFEPFLSGVMSGAIENDEKSKVCQIGGFFHFSLFTQYQTKNHQSYFIYFV